MRVRCSFCGAEYEAAVTRAALLLVGRCERCGRARLRSADAPPPADASVTGHRRPREPDRPDTAA
jgi:hypothetical protein